MGLVVLSNDVSIRGYSKLTLLVWTFFASINVPLHLRRGPSIRLCCLIVESSRPEHLMSYVQPSPSLRQEHLPSDNQHKPYPQKANFGVHSSLLRLAIWAQTVNIVQSGEIFLSTLTASDIRYLRHQIAATQKPMDSQKKTPNRNHDPLYDC